MAETYLTMRMQASAPLQLSLSESRDHLRIGLSPPVAVGGTNDYNELDNKPRINGVILKNDKTSEELGIQAAGDYADSALTNSEIEELLRNFV